MAELIAFRKGPTENSGGGAGNSGGPPHNEDVEDRVVKLEQAMSSLPTKADFAELRADVKIGISDLRAEMHKNSIDIHRWMLATVVGLFLGFGGLFLAMSNGLKQPAPQQQSPTIITVPVAPVPTVASPITQPASR